MPKTTTTAEVPAAGAKITIKTKIKIKPKGDRSPTKRSVSRRR